MYIYNQLVPGEDISPKSDLFNFLRDVDDVLPSRMSRLVTQHDGLAIHGKTVADNARWLVEMVFETTRLQHGLPRRTSALLEPEDIVYSSFQTVTWKGLLSSFKMDVYASLPSLS